MGRRSLSKTKKQQISSELKHKWINIAAERYAEDKEAPKENRKGLHKICTEVENECFAETKKAIKIAKSTVWDRVKGRRSIRDFNAEKRWLSEGEEAAVIEFAIDVVQRGFPLNHRRLKEHVEHICRARLGDQFPEDGVGKEWTYRFVERHSEKLRPYWSHSLDHSRARAVNPNNVEAYFDLLEKVIEGEEGEEPITEDCIYGMDETGIQQGVGVKERVLGPAGQRVQHQQRSGDRENITVVVTICADGTTIPPAVIYKGDAYQTSWKQDNPLKASLGHSPNGYVDGEIGVEWIQQFDKQTKAKAAGRRRLLIVDGHSSHYTHGFLEYARQNNIHVLCYPSHSTHVLQGLDVVIFSVLKRAWTKARDAYEAKYTKVTKSNFLEVYARAHTAALTPENIKAAFRKTGVVPFNRMVVTPAMMAPSLETSSHGSLPLRQPSPIRELTKIITEQHRSQPGSSSAQPSNNPAPCTPTRTRRRVVDALTGTSAAYLVSPSPISSNVNPPQYITSPISPPKRRYEDLLTRDPATAFEATLQKALRESSGREASHKESMMEMQAGMVLVGAYVDQAHEKLQEMDKHGKQRRKKKARLVGDGLPRLLDGDRFFGRVEEFEEEQRRKQSERESRKREKEEYGEKLDAWKQACKERKGRVDGQRDRYQVALSEWEKERELAKQEHRRLGWPKPKLGRLEPVPTKPKLRKQKGTGEDEDGDEDEGDQDEDAGSDQD